MAEPKASARIVGVDLEDPEYPRYTTVFFVGGFGHRHSLDRSRFEALLGPHGIDFVRARDEFAAAFARSLSLKLKTFASVHSAFEALLQVREVEGEKARAGLAGQKGDIDASERDASRLVADRGASARGAPEVSRHGSTDRVEQHSHDVSSGSSPSTCRGGAASRSPSTSPVRQPVIGAKILGVKTSSTAIRFSFELYDTPDCVDRIGVIENVSGAVADRIFSALGFPPGEWLTILREHLSLEALALTDCAFERERAVPPRDGNAHTFRRPGL